MAGMPGGGEWRGSLSISRCCCHQIWGAPPSASRDMTSLTDLALRMARRIAPIVALAVVVGDAPVVVEDGRAYEFAQAGPLDCLPVSDGFPCVHAVVVDAGFRAQRLTEPVADEFFVVGVYWAGQVCPCMPDFGGEDGAVGFVFGLGDAYFAAGEDAEGEHAVWLGAQADGLDVDYRAFDGDALQGEV